VYELPRYMSAAQAAQQLMTVVANRQAAGTDSSHLGNQDIYFYHVLFLADCTLVMV